MEPTASEDHLPGGADAPRDPRPLDEDALDRVADRILRENLEAEREAQAQATDEPGGLTWIRATLKSGGDAEEELLGTLFHGKYRILRKIGAGGFGVVYDALDERGAQNRVALKIMLPGLTQSSSPLDMFRGEAVRVTRLNHPNIVDWKNFDCTPDGRYYFVMELLDGQPLHRVLEVQGALEWSRASKIMLQILDALRAAHFVGEGQSILHLDLTPKNILLLPERRSRSETVKVIDFGIGQYLGGDDLTPIEARGGSDAAPPVPAERPGDMRTVTSGTKDEEAFRGRAAEYPFKISQACTPEYASPEQCLHIEFADGAEREPRQLDGRADLYSFGIIAYQMLTGRLPFERPAARATYLRLHQEAPIEPWGDAEGKVPAPLRHFVERCLEKDPDRRWKDTQEAHEELEKRLRPRVWRKFVAAAVALVLLGMAIAEVVREDNMLLSVWSEATGGDQVDTLYHGPSGTDLRVFLFNDGRPAPVDADVEWTLRTDDDSELRGWSVAQDENSAALLIKPEPEFVEASSGRIEYEGLRLQRSEKRDLHTSEAFTLVWLGRGWWEFSLLHEGEFLISSSTEAEPQSILSIDPEGLELEFQLEQLFLEDLRLEQLSLIYGGLERRLEAKKKSLDATLLCSFPGLDDGRHECTIVLANKAGGQERVTLALDVRSSLPEFQTLLHRAEGDTIEWNPKQPRKVFPDSEEELIVKVARPLRVAGGAPGLETPRQVKPHQPLRFPLARLPESRLPGSFQTVSLRLSDEVICSKSRRDQHEKTLELSLLVIERREIEPELRGRDSALGRRLAELTPSAGQAQQASALPALDAWVPAYRGDEPIWLDLQVPHTFDQLLLKLSVEGDTPDENLEFVELDGAALQIQDYFPGAGGVRMDGRYRFGVSVYVQRDEAANTERDLELIIDSTPPRIARPRLSPEQGIVLKGESSAIEINGEVDHGTEVFLEWSVRREGGQSLAAGLVRPDRWDAPGSSCTWTIDPFAGGQTARRGDGLYEVRIEAVDRCDNRRPLAPIVFTLARRGPEIVYKSLKPFVDRFADWEKTALGLQQIEIEAFDPNGIESLNCQVFSTSAGIETDASPDWEQHRPIPGIRRLEQPRSGVESAEWSWSFEPGHDWSEAEDIYITVKATDVHGATSYRNNGPFRLPRIPKSYPLEWNGMLLVEGNHEQNYTLGGRDPGFENERLEKLGMTGIWVERGLGKPGETQEPWNLSFAVDEIQTYYLDRREVSRGEFLGFLDSESAYGDPGNWLDGRAPDSERRSELRRLLSGSDPDSPAVGLRFDEAHAYATWKGKRLPTLLELEYAIRRGSEYRVHAGVAAPRGDSPDEAKPWSRLEGLSHGAEWTCSPQRQAGQEGVDRYGIPKDPALFQPPAAEQLASAIKFWVNGSLVGRDGQLPESPRIDFAMNTARRRGSANALLGFRCARSARDVQASPDEQEHDDR